MDRLSLELRLIILESLPVGALLAFRRTSQTHKTESERVLATRGLRLYLHPTRLGDVLAVCTNNTLASLVTEVVVLGRSTPPMQTRPNLTHLDPHLHLHRSWPQFLDTAITGREPTYTKLVTAELEPLAKNYAPLIEAIRGLPKITKLSYRPECDEEGLCPVTSKAIAELATTPLLGHLSASFQRRSIPWSDAEIVLALLSTSETRYKALVWQQPLPMCREIRWSQILTESSYCGSREGDLKSLGSEIMLACKAVTEFRLTVPGNIAFGKVYGGMLARMKNIRKLQIFVHTIVQQKWDRMYSQAKRLGEDAWEENLTLPGLAGPFPVPTKNTLVELEICGASGIPNALAADNVLQLLRLLSGSLQSVVMRNVFFSEYQGHVDIQSAMTAISFCLVSGFPELKSVELSVARRMGCHGSCQISHASNSFEARHDVRCKLYLQREDGRQRWCWVGPQAFEELAAQLDVTTYDDHWEFGEWVARQNPRIKVKSQ